MYGVGCLSLIDLVLRADEETLKLLFVTNYPCSEALFSSSSLYKGSSVLIFLEKVRRLLFLELE